MTQVTIVTGCAGTGKTGRLLDQYQLALERARLNRRPGSTLWLAPTRRIQRAITHQVITRCGTACFAPNILTFDLFADKILQAAGRPASPISPVMKRLLLRRIAASLRAQGEIRHFDSIAATTGFLDVVSSFISELKREEIWPDEFVAACRQRNSAFARRDLELGLIYADYQKHLSEQNWYDNEGRFWLARTALGEGIKGPFSEVQFLAVDGFADFTQTQYEILGYLAAWIDETSISLTVEHPQTRPDLFSKPQAAIARIREHLPDEATFRMERLSNELTKASATVRPNWSNSISVIADRLFSNPRFDRPSADAQGLEVIAATGQWGEWEAVARRIKIMLARESEPTRTKFNDSTISDRVRPQDIVIGLRSISDDGPRLRDYLTSAGLPVWCEAELAFTSSSIVKAIVSLLNFELEDWKFERLLAVLDSNFFRPKWPEANNGQAVRAVSAILRRLQINSGRDIILRALARYSQEALPAAGARHESLTELARIASPLLVKLSRCLDKLRRSHTLLDWADVLATIAEDLGWTNPTSSTSDPLTVIETRDLDLLQRILRTAAEADQKVAQDARLPMLTLAEFTSELRDLLSHETVNAASEQGGCIRILSMEQIRNLEVPHLFLVGLTERNFPMNRADDCLFSESERQDFIARGVPLSHRSQQHAEEMFLFYSIVTRARSTLTLSYPAVNSKGQPVFPSPYVTALASLFVPDAVATAQEGRLDPVPSLERVLTPTDLRLAAIAEARKGHPELFRAVLEIDSLRTTCWNTLAACDVAEHRFHERGFTDYEGRLNLPQNLQSIRQRFGAHHQFSATELEAYAKCPFRFWLSTVLRIGPVESPEDGTDYAERGTRLHEVLARLLVEGAMSDQASLELRFQELVNLELDRQISETDFQRALVHVERRILSQWAEAFTRQQADYEEHIGTSLSMVNSLAPEIPFGRLPDAPASERNAYPPIQFGLGENAVNMRGRIDRVDVGTADGRPAYLVIDYKTGQRPSLKDDDLIAGRSIQLALYLLAIKRLGLVAADAIPYQLGYWALRDTGFKHALGGVKFKRIDSTEIEWLETLLDQLLPDLAEEIRSGRFVVENKDLQCTGRCPYHTVCRVNQIRPLAQLLDKASPARIHPADTVDKCR